MDKTAKLFAANLKALRDERNLTQETLAERLGVWPNTVQSYESGRRFPKPSVIDQIAEVLGVSPAKLFLKKGEIPKPTAQEARDIIAKIIESPLFNAAGSMLAEIDSDDIEGVMGFLRKTQSLRQDAKRAGLIDQSGPVKKRKLSQ